MLKTKIESLLFISNKPFTYKSLFNILKKDKADIKIEEIENIVEELKQKYNTAESGIHIVFAETEFQMVTNPECSDTIAHYIKDDLSGELTQAQLETLTVVAYRGPITKASLEQIRGVNCSLIIRNLLIRGLIQAEENKENLEIYYSVTVDFLKFIGLETVTQLPNYEKLNKVDNLEEFLEAKTENNLIEKNVD